MLDLVVMRSRYRVGWVQKSRAGSKRCSGASYAVAVECSDEFVEAVMASPLGATLLAVLESRTYRDEGMSLGLETTPASVSAAVALVHTMSFGSFVELAVFTGLIHVGPWIGDAPETAAAAYRNAPARLPIAEAIAERFGNQLHAPVEHSAQQWWTDGNRWIETRAPLFQRLGEFVPTHGAGEFTVAGLWTATDPPSGAAEQMVAAWELETGPVSRWWMPARPEARVFEILGPQDWARLVTDHPRQAQPHQGWELPGINQRRSEIASLLEVHGQRAARTTVASHLVPDWESVAGEYDGVHLSWAGFITSEGYVSDLELGGVAMLRYWFSERTLWLADVFDEPHIAPDPHIDFSSVHEPPRQLRPAVDSVSVLRMLGRLA